MKSKTVPPAWLRHPLVPKLLSCLLKGYSRDTFKKDLFSGLTVGIIALPLALAFAIASGVEPSRGLYTAVIAGFLCSLLGGSRVLVGGPTGAFVVIVYSTIERHGYEGLVMATLLAAVFLIILGVSGLGRLIRFVPYPLIIGFTTGLAFLIFTSQIRDFFGLALTHAPADFIGKWIAYFQHIPTMSFSAFSVGLGSLLGIIAMRKWTPALPWGICTIVLATLFCWAYGLNVETIGSRYGALPQSIPAPSFPAIALDLDKWRALFPDAIAIAVLAGLESLLCAVMADGMTGSRHKPDCELVSQGIANAASVLCGGIPATAAIARTAANVKTGAKTPISGIIHALVLLVIMLVFSPLVSHIPLAALAAVLMAVAWNMAELNSFFHVFNAPRADIAVMITSFVLTVFVDLTYGVQMAMILALFLFMRRISEKAKTLEPVMADVDRMIPEGLEIFRLKGPLFFGVVDKIRDLAHPMRPAPRVFLLEMEDVHMLDASGMYALREVAMKCQKQGTRLLLSGVHGEVHTILKRFGLLAHVHPESVFTGTKEAFEYASSLLSPKLAEPSLTQPEANEKLTIAELKNPE